MHRCTLLLFVVALGVNSPASRADILRWDNGQVIPRTQRMTPGPGFQSHGFWLQFADLSEMDLTGAQLHTSDLTSARFTNSTLAGAFLIDAALAEADLSGALITGANLSSTTYRGLVDMQIYSSASYQAKDLQGILLQHNDLTGWDFSGQNLTGADFSYATLTDINFTGAVVAGAVFAGATNNGLTKNQIYSTASYQVQDLRGIRLSDIWQPNDLSGWDFSGQDLSGADLSYSTLTDADFTNAIITGAGFIGASSRGLTKEQIYGTASYKAKNLRGIKLSSLCVPFYPDYESNLTGWDFSDQDLTGADLSFATVNEINLKGAIVTRAGFAGTTSMGLTEEHIYSTASYEAKDLRGMWLDSNDFSGWDFSGQNLASAFLGSSILRNADLTGADLRGAQVYEWAGAILHNTIMPEGTVAGLDLAAGERLVVRDDDGVPDVPPSQWLTPRSPIGVTIEDRLAMARSSVVQLQFEADEWESIISFERGIPVQLGGALELAFADNVDVSTQVGRSLRLFDWTGVSPSGAFNVSSSYLWDLSNLYTTGDVRLTGTGGVADYDGNGLVDQGDLDLVLLNWGSELTDLAAIGWINDLPIGAIDQQELDKVLLNWGSAASTLAASSIPEPSAAVLVLVCFVALYIRGRQSSARPRRIGKEL